MKPIQNMESNAGPAHSVLTTRPTGSSAGNRGVAYLRGNDGARVHTERLEALPAVSVRNTVWRSACMPMWYSHCKDVDDRTC